MYQNMKAKVLSGRMELPADKELIKQLTLVEEHLSPSGLRKYEAPRGEYDDHADVVAMLLYHLEEARAPRLMSLVDVE
jgi:hypothetical protein